jgi:predicted nucleic acid-binding protein
MSGSKIFIDTNIVIYLLNGDETLKNFLNKKEIYISFITELELLSFPGITSNERIIIKKFISDCHVVEFNTKMKEVIVSLKSQHKTKLPDAIIAASAMVESLSFLTADKGFSKFENELDVLIFEP